MINIIVACSRRNGMGLRNKLPWNLKHDLQNFQKKTIGNENNCVIMGRRTWESLPKTKRPLPRRHNIIVSNTMCTNNEYTVCNSIENAFQFSKKYNFDETWVIGGAQVYDAALRTTKIDEIHLTRIKNDIPCDTFFPNIAEDYTLWHTKPWITEGEIEYRFEIHTVPYTIPNFEVLSTHRTTKHKN